MATKTQILKYALLPGIIPRILAIFRSGFVHMAYTIAVIYANVRLLPPNHPYLMPENVGRYGIRHVIAEAARNLVFSRKHIDQIIIFFTILAGLVLLLTQFILLIAAIAAEHPAYAMGTGLTIADLFQNPNGTTGSLGPDQDIAFILLDRVFGIGNGTAAGNLFNSCVANLGVQCTDLNGTPMPNTPTVFPFPFHLALHQMLRFYSYGIFIVGVSVIIYFVTTIAAETAQTGTPFGQRFNKAWAPIRFIVFFALIIPLETPGQRVPGLNAAQLITFQVVKLGSNMATNGWAYFNNGAGSAGISASYLSQQYDIVAKAKIPEINDLLKAVYTARACASAYALGRGLSHKIDAYLIRPPRAPGYPASGPAGASPPTPDAVVLRTTPYAQAVAFANQGNLIIRFGRLGQNGDDPNNPGSLSHEYATYMGNVKPYCGEVTILAQGLSEPGADSIFQAYYEMVQEMWDDIDFKDQGKCLAEHYISLNNPALCTTPLPTKAWADSEVTYYTGQAQTAILNGIANQRSSGAFNLPPGIMERGWGGAAIWYNRIAEMNGAVTTATLNIPKMSKLPLLMQVAVNANRQEQEYVNFETVFHQDMGDPNGLNVLFSMEEIEREMLISMTKAHEFWVADGGASQSSNFNKSSGNIIVDFLNTILGTSAMFEMRENTNVHPLAQLAALGKGMMEATLRNAAGSIVLWGAEAAAATAKDDAGKQLAASLSGFFSTMALLSIGIAAILYYVLPLLPFIYFMFAISGWIKSIFEAIVAMPLWALAHLRIDGEGLPGPGASNGYFLLLEIFLRPVLIIFGFLASVSVFTALVNVLNQIFDLVVANVGGYDYEMEAGISGGSITNILSKLDFGRGALDEFFYTAIYTIICYIMGLSCFKLVDLIPNNILRWMGVSVSTFQENAGDPAGQLTSNVYRGSILVGNQVKGMKDGDLAAILAGGGG